MQRLVRFDNILPDNLFVKVIEGENYDEIYTKAWQLSKQSGLFEGNFDIFKIDHNGNFVVELQQKNL